MTSVMNSRTCVDPATAEAEAARKKKLQEKK